MTRTNLRVAEETQLTAEVKWIEEALKKIRKQRNCLQIERLHLESMITESKLILGKKENKPGCANVEVKLPEEPHSNIEFNEPKLDEVSCNTEQLNLEVHDHCYDNMYSGHNYDTEEDDDDDDCTTDDVMIDMNMLMNGDSVNKWK